MMRRFVIVGSQATASDDFLLDDLPGSSGRLDVGLRCMRAAMLFSHGLRRDVIVYLVLRGGARAPRVMRVSGADVRFLRPDERSLAVLAKKALASDADAGASGFVEVRPGIAVASGDLERVVADLGGASPYVLEEGGPDLREVPGLGDGDVVFFVGDHVGFDDPTRAKLLAVGARPLGVGPVALHAEDAIAVVSNELDRRDAARVPNLP
jgi:tRNA (pseudouridine54-N1)-methyltransferase